MEAGVSDLIDLVSDDNEGLGLAGGELLWLARKLGLTVPSHLRMQLENDRFSQIKLSAMRPHSKHGQGQPNTTLLRRLLDAINLRIEEVRQAAHSTKSMTDTPGELSTWSHGGMLFASSIKRAVLL